MHQKSITFELSGAAELRPVEGRRPATNFNVLLALTPTTPLQFASAKSLFTSHHVQDEDAKIIVAVKDSTWRFDNLPIVAAFELRRI